MRWTLACFGMLVAVGSLTTAAEPIDFNRQIRPILSNNCFACHGPDKADREAGLRLDERDGALGETDSGAFAIVPGKPEASELIARITSDDEYTQMPPPEKAKALSAAEVKLLRDWIAQGAPYAKHWSYVTPRRPDTPSVQRGMGARNSIDRFVLARLEAEGLVPAEEAERAILCRRVTLDLTGLPPTPAEVEAFVNDRRPDAYERLVDRLLASPAFGEHWARMWLDLARYADSAGYADDPPRTIWAYRDWVIRAINRNQPFDQFTVDQLAGDLGEQPTPEQLIATAFHRNTLTNNEGGTNDEEFRSVAVVDRVNTTLAVWMGSTIACAQCHDHKYDPISQEDFFSVYAALNNTEDADRRNESPTIPVFTAGQQRQRERLEREIAELEATITQPTPALLEAQAEWERSVAEGLRWEPLHPLKLETAEKAPLAASPDGTVRVNEARKSDVTTVELRIVREPAGGPMTALRIETLPDPTLPGQGAGYGDGNFVLTHVEARLLPPGDAAAQGRFVRVELPGQGKILSLAEVQVFSGGKNVAPAGKATQSSVDYNGPAKLANDGNTNGQFEAGSVTHTKTENAPWWEVDLGGELAIERIAIWNRLGLEERLAGCVVQLLDANREVVWETTVAAPPKPSLELALDKSRPLAFAAATADFEQPGFTAAAVLDDDEGSGWAVGGKIAERHTLSLLLKRPLAFEESTRIRLLLSQRSEHENHTLGRFRVQASLDPRASDILRLPSDLRQTLAKPPAARTDSEKSRVTEHFLTEIAAETREPRQRLAQLKAKLAAMKPATTVPVLREMAQGRVTKLQYRGNFLDTGPVVEPGVPEKVFPWDREDPVNRRTLAQWIVDERNPLTARVAVNRFWEKIFGRGLVVTSEEFGSQGEQPSHPELLDYLAVEFMDQGWDSKAIIRHMVTSAAYRRDSRVTDELFQRDPDNVLLARGPRVRLTAESIRDQALAIGGLLSSKMYGAPVKPPQPNLGVNAAFGGAIDWKTSQGEDRFRRGLYTTWRRSNPYPSMAAFDAPNREVCTIRRPRTNTPLQALVTLNDPVYVEAAQGLARRVLREGGPSLEERATYAFRLCLARRPSPEELEQVVALWRQAETELAKQPEQARKLATVPIGPAPAGMELPDLAAWTVVGNVLLNLDETLMKR